MTADAGREGQAFDWLASCLALQASPFCEEPVITHVISLAHHEGLPVTRDAVGNVMIHWPGLERQPGWIFQAHADHPGFVIGEARGRRAIGLWLGDADPKALDGGRVRAGEAIGRVRRLGDGPCWTHQIGMDFDRPVRAGEFGSWDLPPVSFEGDEIVALAIDDLVGVALASRAVLQAMQRKTAHPVAAVLTRGEEVGFFGALRAVDHTWPVDGTWINIDASPETEVVQQGGGVVIRSGDRYSEFDLRVIRRLEEISSESGLEGSARTARMTGGICEATVLSAAGKPCAALALPVKFHHDKGPSSTVTSERILRSDFLAADRLVDAILAEAPAIDARTRERDDEVLDRFASRLIPLERLLDLSG